MVPYFFMSSMSTYGGTVYSNYELQKKPEAHEFYAYIVANKADEGENSSLRKRRKITDYFPDKLAKTNQETEDSSGDKEIDEPEPADSSVIKEFVTIYHMTCTTEPRCTIEKIMTEHNKAHKKNAYKPYDETKNIAENSSHRPVKYNSCIGYHNKGSKVEPLSKKLSEVISVFNNFVVFFFQEKDDENLENNESEIFVFTKGHGYTVLNTKPCRKLLNYEFPSKMAARLLDDRGYMARTERPCFGTTLEMIRKFTTFQKLSRMEPLAAILEYKGRLRQDSSFFGVAGLKSECMVKIRESNVRFETKLEINKFPNICDHLDDIWKGKATWNTKNEGECDSKVFEPILTTVSPGEEYMKLEKQLWMQFYEGIQKSKEDESLDKFATFELCPSQLDDYFSSREVKLMYKGAKRAKTSEKWGMPPMLEDVIPVMKIKLDETMLETNGVSEDGKVDFFFRNLT